MSKDLGILESTLTYDKFLETYEPTHNFHRTDAPFDGKMYETFGVEYEHVKRNAEYAWTIVDSEEEMFVVPGIRFVNRFGYFVTTQKTDFTITEILID